MTKFDLSGFAGSLLGPDRITIADIGARGGPERAWMELRRFVRFIGVEPGADDFQPEDRDVWFRKGLSDEHGRASFYQTRMPDYSSLLRPLRDAFEEAGKLSNIEPLIETTIEVTTLDSLAQETEIEAFDLIKLDVQGAELAILRGAPQMLPRALAVTCEVAFAPMYEGQPLFSEVEIHLRRSGFSFVSFDGLFRTRSAIARQLGYAHRRIVGSPSALFVRSPSSDQERRRAAIIFAVYGHLDLAYCVLSNNDRAARDSLVAAMVPTTLEKIRARLRGLWASPSKWFNAGLRIVR